MRLVLTDRDGVLNEDRPEGVRRPEELVLIPGAAGALGRLNRASIPVALVTNQSAVGRGLIGMVLADLYTAISGIGYLIVRTASTYQVDKMFVPIVTLGLLGVTLTALLRLLEKTVAPWTAASQED